jgi:hypothetical protein
MMNKKTTYVRFSTAMLWFLAIVKVKKLIKILKSPVVMYELMEENIKG